MRSSATDSSLVELTSLPLPPSARAKLAEAGFVFIRDLDGLTPAELAEQLQMSPEAAGQLLAEVLLYN